MFLTTPGFDAMRKRTVAVNLIAAKAGVLLASQREISWVVGRPDAVDQALEDEGRTLVVRSPEAFWAIRDDHDPACTCGCGGQSVVTYLLPDEY